MGKASQIVKTAYDTVMEKYGKVYYRRDNNPTQYGWEYNVGKYHDGIWSFDCLGFVHTMVNGFCGDQSKLGGGAVMDNFVLAADENTTLNSYCTVKGTFPKNDIKPGSLLKQDGHVGLYIGEMYVPEIDQTINVAEVCMSMGGGGKFSWVDTSTGKRYRCKGGSYLSTWTNWGQFDRVTYDGGMPDVQPDPQPAPEPSEQDIDLEIGALGIDMSYHQGSVNWSKLFNQGIRFAIIREGWGWDSDGQGADDAFFQYVNGARQAGIKVMIYHFIYGINADEAIENAKCAIRNAEKAGIGKDTIIWCDLEYDTVDNARDYRGVNLTNQMQRAMAESFCDYILQQGYPTGIYTNRDYVTRVYGEDILQHYDIWLADLAGADDYPCVIRQYDWYSKYDGILVNVDKDVFRGNYTAGTAKYKGDTPSPEPTPDPQHKEMTTEIFAGFMPVLQKGADNDFVAVLQKCLRYTGDYKDAVDGSFGPNTDKAVRSFQQRTGLEVDGNVGPKTWTSLIG